MSHHVSSSRAVQAPVVSALLLTASCLIGLVAPARGQIDTEVNLQVWKQKFGVLDAQLDEQAPYTGWLSQDANGDGVKNRDEFLAGTNPFANLPGEAHFRPPTVAMGPSSLSLTFPTVAGKLYGVESSETLIDAWSSSSLPSASGDGSDMTLVVPKTAGKFFHLTVTDQATQGDMVSDWAKIALGLTTGSPIESQTSFDHTTLAANLATQNVVSISAVDTAGTQPSDNLTPAGDFGLIRVSRSGYMALGNVSVTLSRSGTAVEGTDFEPLPASVTFPAGVNSLDVKITPKFNVARTSPATVFLTLASPGSSGTSGNFTLGSPASAGVTIYPSGNPTGTGLTGDYYSGSSSTYDNAANFGGVSATYSYTKTGSTVNATITYAGTPATAFADGNPVTLQFTSGNLSTSFNSPLIYTIAAPLTATTFKVNFTAASVSASGSGNLTIGAFAAPLTRLDPLLDFASTALSFHPPLAADNFTVRWTGQVLPQYSQTYDFVVNCDDSAKLWLNGQPQVLQRSTNDNPSVAYTYTQNTSTTGTVVVAYNSAPISVGDVVKMYFSVGSLTASFGTVAPYTVTAVSSSNFTVELTGENLPVSDSNSTNRCRIDTTNFIIDWPTYSSVDRYCSIPLVAGVLYDLKLEYREGTGSAKAQLSWYSEDQAKQIIPTGRLFPTISGNFPQFGVTASPPAITSSTNAVAILGADTPFSMNVSSSNGGTVSSPDLPNWLTLVNGVLSGTPPAAGTYQFTLTTTNGTGTSSVVMTLEILDTPDQLTRELWTSGVTGPEISKVPWTAPPSSSSTVTTAESAGALADNTGERLRGYFTAPVTGNYYFWIAASNAAELWISNNSEPVNKVLRASVTGPGGTTEKTWNTQTSQKSRWLSLIAGKRYYIEALHNSGATGASSHLSVAWFLDPTGNTASPITTNCAPASPTVGGIIPSHVLSPWDNPPTTAVPGTLYVTNLQGSTGVTATGGAFLRVNGNTAVLHLNYSGLSSGAISRKIYKKPAVPNTPGIPIFDIDAQERNYPALKTSDEGYTWNMQAADLADLNNGGVYLGISTLNNPNGELAGTFGITAGSQTPPAIPTYPSWTDNHATSEAENSRFLTQSTFGPSPSDMSYVKLNGYEAWIDSQLSPALGKTKNVPYILENLSADPQNPYGSTLMFNSWWKNSVTASDQLRQRAAFALSEILVVSDVGPLNNNGRVLADYYDTLLDTCFGNFRDILKQVTLSPAMGVYLDMRGNAKGDIVTGLHPNENYSREILQLFSAGLYRTWPDGTLVLDSSGNAVPTYDQSVITGMARVFTGWTWGQPVQGNGRLPTGFNPASNYLDPMVLVPSKHEFGTKILLDNVVLPAAVNTNSATSLVDPTPIYIQSTDPVNGQGTPVTTAIYNQYDLNGLKDLEATLDNIMENSAVGPYICRQLIQRLVTSHPKPEYVHRVVRAYNGEWNVDEVATGVRGDMKEVFRAILLDYEARSTTAAADVKFGKQREPLLRVTGPARAFPAAEFPGSTYSQNGTGVITITTPSPHKLTGGTVRLSDFVDSGSSTTQTPTAQPYPIGNITANSFTVNNANASVTISTYSIVEVSTGVYSSTIIPPAGLADGDRIYLKFTAGELAGGSYDGEYTIGTGGMITISSAPAPTVPAPTRTCLVPRLTSGYNVTGSAGAQTITIQTPGNHNLVAGDLVQLNFNFTNSPLPAVNGVYTVASVTNSYGQGTPNTFKVAPLGTPPATITNGSQGNNSVTVYPLKGTHWVRSGTCSVGLSTWGISKTDSNLNQTPMNSTTVFNFFYPDYQYPGAMAQAGMTTPEFQLTNDSNTMNLTNVLMQALYTNFSGATNGYGSFFSNNAITMDITPYMTPTLTANEGIPGLVDTLGDLMTGGNLSDAVKDAIKTHVASTTYPYTTPTSSQMRDRVRVIVNLIAISADYAIQK